MITGIFGDYSFVDRPAQCHIKTCRRSAPPDLELRWGPVEIPARPPEFGSGIRHGWRCRRCGAEFQETAYETFQDGVRDGWGRHYRSEEDRLELGSPV